MDITCISCNLHVMLSTWGNRWMFIYIHIHTLYIDLIRRWVCRYVRGDVDTSSLAGDTAFAYDTSSVNTHEKHDSPRSRNSDTSRKVKSTRALDKNLYVCNKIHLYHNHLVDSIRRTKLKENNLEPFRHDGIWIYCMLWPHCWRKESQPYKYVFSA